MKQVLMFALLVVSVAFKSPGAAMAQSYKLVDIKPYKLERTELTWMVDFKHDEQPWKLRYQRGNNDIVLSFQYPTWNEKTKRIEIGLSIGPVNDGQVRLDLIDVRSMTLIGQISASTSVGTLSFKKIKLTPRRSNETDDPETFTLRIVFDDGKGCRIPLADYVFKRVSNS